MRILFFGTAAFAVPALGRLLASAHEVVGVVTQPDKPAGRGRHVTPPPVAKAARAAGLPLLQPASLEETAARGAIQRLAADCFAVVAYGNFLPPSVLDLPAGRCVNVHPSLLPKYRGAAPINWAILNGETVTGVTTMYVAREMDAGDILQQQQVPITSEETAAELGERLAPIGAELLVETLDRIAAGSAMPTPQDPARVVLAPALTKADGRIDWHRPAAHVRNRIRGLQPWPTAYTHLGDRQLAIFRADYLDEPTDAAPGTILRLSRAIHVATGDHRQLCLTNVQLAGKRRMDAPEFLRGHPVATGTVLA